MRLDGKVALVTGGASGIGRGIADLFAEAGASVAVMDIAGASGALRGDVSRDEDARAAVESTVERFGALDVLINNAGVELYGDVTELAPEEWDRQLAVNLKGAYLCSRHAIPRMRGRGGAIVNIASVHAFVSWPRSPAYDASKAGLLGLTRAMALDHGPEGIRVNAICPGYIDTPLLEKWLVSVPDRDATLRQVLAAHPVGRMGTPRDIAHACLFLASDAAAFITGACLVVDGGMTVAGH